VFDELLVTPISSMSTIEARRRVSNVERGDGVCEDHGFCFGGRYAEANFVEFRLQKVERVLG
jgi:hypothetical protein